MTSRKKTESTPDVTQSAELSERGRKAWKRWRHARTQIEQWETIRDKARSVLETEIGEHPGASVNGVQVISWTPTSKPRRFDQAAFKADHPDLFEQYYGYGTAPRPFRETEFDFDVDEVLGE